tara:strand:+ start:304 stop:768 length:465 start_codon:yes stop_codon:yes gene_type:complete
MILIGCLNQLGNVAHLFAPMFDTAFPYNKNTPARLIQGSVCSPITTSIALKLGLPKRRPSLRHRGIETVGMSMPETAVYKDHQIMTRKNNIRRAGEAFPMQPEAVSTGMQILSQNDFRMSVLSLNRPHHSGASRGINDISHHFRPIISINTLQI